MAHGTLAAYRRHKHAGEAPCGDCVDGARRQWRAKARRRMELRREEVLATGRRSHARAVRCVVCGRVVRPVQLVGVEPARAPRDRALPCHADCALRDGRRVVATGAESWGAESWPERQSSFGIRIHSTG
jgi:hypothetical protein